MAEIDYTFGGQLEWDIQPQNFETDTIAEGLQRDIEATRETWSPVEKNIILETTIILACTNGVKIVGKKKPAAAVLEMVAVINFRPPADQLIAWRLKLPYKLRDAWMAAWTAGQDMFSVDPAQLPDENLTPSQQEELKDKNSPLVVTA